jgi:hypothetical protein
MTLIKNLPKYTKTWTKEPSIKGYSETEQEVYIIAEQYDPIRHHGVETVVRLKQWPNELYPAKGMYFFELFKYLRKYQLNSIEEERMGPRFALKLNDADLKKCIKQHLLLKHSKKLTRSKLTLLPEYSQLIDYCFNTFLSKRGTKISLVIQKKKGYKYYENIVYT